SSLALPDALPRPPAAWFGSTPVPARSSSNRSPALPPSVGPCRLTRRQPRPRERLAHVAPVRRSQPACPRFSWWTRFFRPPATFEPVWRHTSRLGGVLARAKTAASTASPASTRNPVE